MVTERFLLITAQGRVVTEFESPEAAAAWVEKRKESAKGIIAKLILIKKTTTVVEEILDYV